MKCYLLLPLILLVGCTDKVSKPSPKTVVDLAGYSLALDECREKGKNAGAYSVYEACAIEADKKYGRKGEK